jgi:hypothetical protein
MCVHDALIRSRQSIIQSRQPSQDFEDREVGLQRVYRRNAKTDQCGNVLASEKTTLPARGVFGCSETLQHAWACPRPTRDFCDPGILTRPPSFRGE